MQRLPEAARQDVDRIQLALTALLLACAVVFGGGQGGQGQAGDLLCQLLALALLACLALRWHSRGGAFDRADIVIAAALLLPLWQLLPLPDSAWAFSGLRREMLSELAAAGTTAHGRVSLVPMATERALWALLPALALAWSVLRLSSGNQRLLLWLLMALVLLSLCWGIVQRAQGPASPLRLYAHTNWTDATGFFANRNHLASLLLMALPFSMAAAAWATTRQLAGHAANPVRMLLSLALAVFLILGIAITRSRAGMLLCVLAIMLSVPMVLALGRRRGRRRVIVVVSLIAVLLTLQFAWTGILQRMHRNPFEDARWGFVATTLDAGAAQAPLGSGLGSFREVYARHDPAPTALITNHAHNDWLELWLEGGWPFLMLAAAFIVFFAWAGWKAWRARGDDILLLRTRAAWIGLLLAMLHALVDYALRTTANMVVFALLLAVLLSGLAAIARSRPDDSIAESG